MNWLYSTDPRVKLYFSALGITLCLLLKSFNQQLSILVFCQVVLFTGGVSLRQIAALWKGLTPLVLILMLVQFLFFRQEGYASILKLLNAAFFVTATILTTSTQQLVRSFEKFGLPYSVSMAVGMALQYFKTLVELYQKISEAQQARGWDAAEQGFIRRVKAMVPRLIALVIASLRMSDALALGLAARGFGSHSGKHSYRRDLKMCSFDWIIGSLCTIVFFIILFIMV